MIIYNIYGKNIWENKKLVNLMGADLRGADLIGANLRGADLYMANLSRANLRGADLSRINLIGANLMSADLTKANLYMANLMSANLMGTNLSKADLTKANLYMANLTNSTIGLVKIMGVEVGNYYWKTFDRGLCNNGYQFKVGVNKLREGEVFASDERKICSYPGFHFASRSWCKLTYPNRPLEAKIRIPEGAKINEPWATDGKASADMIEIIQVFDVETGKDVTDEYR